MTSFVKSHGEASSTVAGASITKALTSTVSAGRTLVVNAQAGSSDVIYLEPNITKPAEESASWVKVAQTDQNESTSSDTLSVLTVWVMVTTVPWPSGTSLTVTWGNNPRVRGISICEYEGLSTEVLAVDYDSDNNAGTKTLSVDTGPVFAAGDVALRGASIYNIDPTTPVAQTDGGTATGTDNLLAGTIAGQGYVVAYTRGYVISTPGNRTATLKKDYRAKGLFVVALKALNYPPNAPTLTTMADGSTVNRGITQRAVHVFSDPVPSDSQSKFDLRYRIVGAASWTTITQTTPNQFYDFPAGALAAGDYERQVRTYDSFGVVGPWSTSGFFTAADAPDGPTITDPVNGSMVATASEPFTWSAPDQDSYQVRKVADDAETPGTPDTTVVYYDSGEVIDSSTRTVQLAYPVNGRTEHLQVRVKYADLWSEWSSIVVDVDYTEPPVPTIEVSTDTGTGSLLISITNPAPAGEDPAAVYNDVYIDDGNGEERRATGVSTNTSWRYWTPVSGRDYSTAVRVVAYAASGASSTSS